MNSAQQSVTEQVKQVIDLQSKAFQPTRIFGGLAVEAMEQIMRKNYTVMGDFVEYSIRQAQIPLNVDNGRDIVSAQMEEFRGFGELMSSRASEYVELAGALSEHARQATDDATAELREVADEAVVHTQQAADEATDRALRAVDEAADRTEKTVDDVSDNAKKAADAGSKNAKKAADVAGNTAKKAADRAKGPEESSKAASKKKAAAKRA